MNVACYGFSGSALLFHKLEPLMKENTFHYILPSYHYLDHFLKEQEEGRLLYVFRDFNSRMRSQDLEMRPFVYDSQDQILNMDKERGYFQLSNTERQKVVNTYWDIYEDFLRSKKIEVVIFPDIETVDGGILLNVCKYLKVKIAYYVNTRILGGSFWAEDQYDKMPTYSDHDIQRELIEKSEKFIESFKEGNHKADLAPHSHYEKISRKSEFSKVLNFFKNRYFFEKYRRDEDSSLGMKIKMKLAKPLNVFRKIKFNIVYAKEFNSQLPKEKYVSYFLQYTPESSINGLCPYYVDQTRAIEAILYCLPPNTKLVIKEHPAIVGIRTGEFYKKLKQHLGVHLLTPGYSSKEVVNGSMAVATITGTVGLEAYLLSKPCIQFGPNFFAHLNKKYEGLEDLKKWLRDIADGNWLPDAKNKKAMEIAKIFHTSHKFYISDPSFSTNTLHPKNIEAIVDSLRIYFRKIGRASET